MKRIEGKVAVVTGGAQGLGKAISMKLAEEGAAVHLFDIGDSAQTVCEMGEKGYEAWGHIVDITDSQAVAEAVNKVLIRNHGVDILVNNAGAVSTHDNLLSVTDAVWDREIAINLTGAFYCCRAVLAPMMQQKSGKIVNISSIAGDTGRIATSPAYSAAKAGIYGLTMSMAKNGAPFGINVNTVCPGVILTGIHDSYPRKALDKLLSEIPYNRGGRPEDIADAVCFLCSPESDYINGVRIRVNGGSYMG